MSVDDQEGKSWVLPLSCYWMMLLPQTKFLSRIQHVPTMCYHAMKSPGDHRAQNPYGLQKRAEYCSRIRIAY